MTHIARLAAAFVAAITLSACGVGPDADPTVAAYAAPLTREEAASAQLQSIGTRVQSGGFTTPPGTDELKCTQNGIEVVCTSSYVIACPSGWSTCTPPPGAKSCCKRRSS